jgi:hypothetical protein
MFTLKKTPVAALVFCLLSFGSATATEEFTGGVSEDESGDKISTHVFKDGIFEWKVGDEVLVSGTYITRGKYLIVTDTEGPRACLDSFEGEGIEVGIYQWEIFDESYYLTVNDDDCSGRQRGFLKLGLKFHQE